MRLKKLNNKLLKLRKMKKPTFEIETYKKSASDKLSVYVLSNDEFEIEDAIKFADENCTTQIELIEENEKSVANEYNFKYAVVFHES
jgi:DNA-directed RNA polymerase alpha subunit